MLGRKRTRSRMHARMNARAKRDYVEDVGMKTVDAIVLKYRNSILHYRYLILANRIYFILQRNS